MKTLDVVDKSSLEFRIERLNCIEASALDNLKGKYPWTVGIK
jgi:hypothetical protein